MGREKGMQKRECNNSTLRLQNIAPFRKPTLFAGSEIISGEKPLRVGSTNQQDE